LGVAAAIDAFLTKAVDPEAVWVVASPPTPGDEFDRQSAVGAKDKFASETTAPPWLLSRGGTALTSPKPVVTGATK
jgi:hypothetical protein